MRQFWRIFRPSFFSFKEFWPRYRGYDLGSFKEANAFCSNLHRSGPLNSGVEVVLKKVMGQLFINFICATQVQTMEILKPFNGYFGFLVYLNAEVDIGAIKKRTVKHKHGQTKILYIQERSPSLSSRRRAFPMPSPTSWKTRWS